MLGQLNKVLHRHKTLLIVLLVVLGAVIRFGWLATTDTTGVDTGEAKNVAVAFAETHTIADAYRRGQGPTAHIMPVTPVIAGTVYRLFGITPTANVILSIWSLLLVFGSYLLFFRAFGRLGMPLPARLAAFAFLALVPFNVGLEVVAFRVWEGGLAVFLAAFCLDQLLRLDAQDHVSPRDVGAMGLLAAACLFVSPAIGLAAYFGGLLLMLRKTDRRRWPGVIGIVVATAAVVLTPWLLRNMAVMERPILLRSNFGLELGLANHPAAMETTDPRATFQQRFKSIHPYGDPTDRAYAAMRAAGGEAAYAEHLGDEAKAWIAANPGDFVSLSGRHLREMLFPPAWLWTQFGTFSRGTLIKQALSYGLTLAALGGIAFGLWRVGARYRYVTGFALLPLLPYLIVQPTVRYRYLFFALFVFIALDFVSHLWTRLTQRTG